MELKLYREIASESVSAEYMDDKGSLPFPLKFREAAGKAIANLFIPCCILKDDTPADIVLAIGSSTCECKFNPEQFLTLYWPGINMAGTSRTSSAFDKAVFLNAWVTAKLDADPEELIGVKPRALQCMAKSDIWGEVSNRRNSICNTYRNTPDTPMISSSYLNMLL